MFRHAAVAPPRLLLLLWGLHLLLWGGRSDLVTAEEISSQRNQSRRGEGLCHGGRGGGFGIGFIFASGSRFVVAHLFSLKLDLSSATSTKPDLLLFSVFLSREAVLKSMRWQISTSTVKTVSRGRACNTMVKILVDFLFLHKSFINICFYSFVFWRYSFIFLVDLSRKFGLMDFGRYILYFAWNSSSFLSFLWFFSWIDNCAT